MPMTQEDIRRHYETEWREMRQSATDVGDLSYSQDFADALVLPTYRALLHDLGINTRNSRVLDIGSGSGRWVRFFLEHFEPERLVAVDFTQSSIDLLEQWIPLESRSIVECRCADVTSEQFTIDECFDLVNVQSVLFHIPEQELYRRALRNLANVLDDDGYLVMNEYMPHVTMRTDWMRVRSRYEIEHELAQAGLHIAAIVPCKFFDAVSMGVDGPDTSVRGRMQSIYTRMTSLLKSNLDPNARDFFTQLFTDIDRTMTAFCRDRIAPVDFPGGKFVVVRRAVC